MATFMDMLNQGLGALNTPVGMLGTQLLAQSGPQAGNPGGGARLGQALAGMSEQQGRQQQMDMQNQLRLIQQQEMALRARGLARQERRDMTMESVLNDPALMGQLSPQQQTAARLGMPIAEAMKLGQAKQPTPPGMFDMPQPDNTYIRKVWNPTTNTYDESVPFMPPQAQTAGVAQERLALEKAAQPIELAGQQATVGARVQNAQTAADRLAMDQAKQLREADKGMMESKFKRLEFKQAYRGAVNQLDEVAQLAGEIAGSKALPNLYGPNGYIPPIAGSDAADLQAKIEQLKAKGGLAELVKLSNNGVKLTPVSNSDLAQAQTSFGNFDKLQSDVQARQVFQSVSDAMRRAMDEAATRYNEYDSLYDMPSTGAAGQGTSTVPAVGTVMDGYRYNGGDPASPQSWSRQ